MWRELTLAMMIEERISSIWPYFQKPYNIRFNQSDELQILGFLLVLQDDHAIIGIIHLGDSLLS
jgi:hypothetical protein